MKKKFIIDPEKYDENKLEGQVTKVLKLCKIDNTGRVLINAKGMSNREKLKLILTARFLANKLDNKIKPNATISEIADNLNVSEDQARARISQVAREGFATSKEKGVYVVVPYRIDDFLEYTEVFVTTSGGEK